MANPKSAVNTSTHATHPVLRPLFARPFAAVMGVLNITPDSFSDGGEFFAADSAIAHAQAMIAGGADIIDIGAESTRPYGNAKPVSAAEERNRLEPILAAVAELGTPASIDTMKAEVAGWAIGQGASIVNDVWGLQRDPDMASVVARHGVPIMIMHNREAADPSLDIVRDMIVFFRRSLAIAKDAGIPDGNIVLDPGIGFGKTPEQSMIALARLDELTVLNYPLLVGASRKRFIASVTPSEPQERLGGSIAAHLLAVQRGAKIIRSHDVAETVQALRVAAAIEDKRQR